MTEMIERVANAMMAEWRTHAPASMSPNEIYWQNMARIAIETMREPTAEMVKAAREEEYYDGTYESMIDAALSRP